MAAATQISVDEYLHTTYRPDCDYVDGQVLERNLGERDHSRPQMRLIMLFGVREKEWGIVVMPEQRVQVKPRRFRIPDVCVVHQDAPCEQIVTTPPLICIEILSKDDSFSSIVDRLDDYVSMGVANIWVIDPHKRRAYTYGAKGTIEAIDGELHVADSNISVPLASIFES
jgi:Uma2 family endonuclease